MDLPDPDPWQSDTPWWYPDGDHHQLALPDPAESALREQLGALLGRHDRSQLPDVTVRDTAGEQIGSEAAWAIAASAAVALLALIDADPPPIPDDELSAIATAASDLSVIVTAAADPGGRAADAALAALAPLVGRFAGEARDEMLRRVRRRRNGSYRFRLHAGEREMLDHLLAQLDAMLESGDTALTRLFPPAYGNDEERSREYAALADHELIASRRAALGQALAVVDGGEADDEAVNAVMRAVNDLRLVIGTKLDVSEDHDEPPSPDDAEATELWVAYHVLGAILTDTIAALRASL